MVHEGNLQQQHCLWRNAKPPSLSTKTIMKLGSSFCNIEPDLLSCEVRPVQQEEGNAPMGVGSSKSNNKNKKPNEEEDKNNNKIIETLPSKKIIQTPSSDVFLSPRSLLLFWKFGEVLSFGEFGEVWHFWFELLLCERSFSILGPYLCIDTQGTAIQVSNAWNFCNGLRLKVPGFR